MTEDDETKSQTQLKVRKLVDDYLNVVESGKQASYNEERVKIAYVVPLLESLGWNFRSDEVLPEQATLTGRADFGLRIGGKTKVFVEVKSFCKSLDGHDTVKGKPRKYADQAIQYAWGMKSDWAVLTNFEELRLYDSHVRKSEDALLWKKPLKFTEYVSRFDDLWLISKRSLSSGALDAYKAKAQRPAVDEAFLEDLMNCRQLLVEDIDENNPGLTHEQINENVQKILDRLIFIKNCEDRLIIPAESLWKRFKAWQETAIDKEVIPFMMDLNNLFRYFGKVYNGKIFEKHSCEELKISNETFAKIIDVLYGDDEHLGYNFSVIPTDILGQAYELYIGSIIKEKQGIAKALEIVREPSQRKEHGIYYTPELVVDYISRNIVEKKLDDCNEPEAVSAIKIVDPACGSGSFLTKAFEIIRNWYERYNLESRKGASNHTLDRHIPRISNLEERALCQNIYGVDLDAQAVEIAILNLSLKAVKTRVKLPYMGDHIRRGNSLVNGTSEELARYFEHPGQMNPFSWESEFPDVFRGGGFDGVIGNPPWVSFGLRGVGKIPDDLERYFREGFPAAEYKLSVYAIFLNRAIDLLKPGGRLGFILPDSFLLGRYFSKLRKYILDKASITEVLLILEDFWRSGTVGRSTILLLQREVDKKAREKNEVLVRLCRTLDDLGTRNFKTFSYPQHYFENISHNRFRLFFDRESKEFVERTGEDSVRLSEIVSIHTGVRSKIGQKAIVGQTKRGENWFAGLISGSEISRYVLDYDGHFLNIEPKLLWSGGWDPNVVLKEKILLRQTGDSLVATIDTEKYYHLNNIHSMVIIDGRYDLRYMLAILNSRLMNHYYHLISLELGRALAQTDIETIEELPIKRLDLSSDRGNQVQTKITRLVDQMLNLNRERAMLLRIFTECVRKFKQDQEGYIPLSKYYSKDEPETNEYCINLLKSRELIDYKAKGKVIDLDCVEQDNSLLLSVQLEGESAFREMIALCFEDDYMRKFFHLSIKTFILKSRKEYWSKEEIWEILEEIKIPRHVSLKTEDASNIRKLMHGLEQAYSEKVGLTSTARLFNLSKVEEEIKSTDMLIDECVFDLYGLSEQDRQLVINRYGKMYGDT